MITSCRTCGLVVDADVKSGVKILCPRCSSLLFRNGQGMKNSFILGLSALILLIPAAVFPFLHILINETRTSATLLQAAGIMFRDGYGLAGAAILLTALVFPVIYLMLIVYISFSCIIGRRLPFVWSAVRILDFFQHFQMTDVFLVGILVSVVKLTDMADVRFGTGFYFLVLTAFMLIASGLYYDRRLAGCRR